MSRVVIDIEATRQLRLMMVTHELPAGTPGRVAASLARLGAFPKLGKRLRGPHAAYRYVRGPWPWIAIVYRFDETTDTLTVVSFQDTRTAAAWTSDR